MSLSRNLKVGINAAVLVTVVAGWVIFWSFSYDYTIRRDLSPRVTLVERHRVNRTPYLGMADNNRSFWLPIPWSSDHVEEQVLERDGKPAWKGQSMYGVGHTFHPSPDDQFVVVESHGDRPMLVIDPNNGTKVTVPDVVPNTQDHYFDYPFQFVRWSDDSSSVLAEVRGTFMEGRELMAYREVWRINPKTAACTRIDRETKYWQEKIKWDE